MKRIRAVKCRLEVKKEDIWIGVFWKTSRVGICPNFIDLMCTDIWICLLPMLPIHISYTWEYNELVA